MKFHFVICIGSKLKSNICHNFFLRISVTLTFYCRIEASKQNCKPCTTIIFSKLILGDLALKSTIPVTTPVII